MTDDELSALIVRLGQARGIWRETADQARAAVVELKELRAGVRRVLADYEADSLLDIHEMVRDLMRVLGK